MMRTSLLAAALGLSSCAPLGPHIQPLPAELAVEPAWEPSPEPIQGDGFSYQDIAIPCGETFCAATLYLPDGPVRAPVVVMGNGFCGRRNAVMPTYAEHFAQQGLAALAFDYRHWGDSGGLPRYVWVAEEQVQDYQSAIAWARQDPRVRGDRLAIWGTSASGGHVMTVGSRDERIDAVVAQVPGITHSGDHEDVFPEGTLWPLVRLAFVDKFRELRDKERIYIRAYGRGEELSFMPRMGQELDGLLLTEDNDWPNVIAPAFLLDIDEYHPDKAALQVTAPTLFVLAEHDTLVHNAGTVEIAGKMADATVETIDADHFGFYEGEAIERTMALELAFLKRHLLGTGVTP